MAESFLLTHSLKTIRARVPKEFLCIPAQYISIITLRGNILPPSFFFHHFFHACSTPNQDKEVFEKKKKVFGVIFLVLRIVYGHFTVSSPESHMIADLCYLLRQAVVIGILGLQEFSQCRQRERQGSRKLTSL